MGTDFPDKLLKNPVFDLLLLERPNLIVEMPWSTLQQLLTQEQIPQYFLELVLKRSDRSFIYTLLFIARNHNISIELLSILARDRDETVRCNVAKNPNISVKLSDNLVRDNYRGVRHCPALNPQVSTEILEILAGDRDEKIRYWVVRNTVEKRLT